MIQLLQATRYRRRENEMDVVLREISLSVSRRERIGVFGSQSSGKSTLARMACGIEQPDEGDVVHAGRVSWPLGFTGFLHQDMTGAENIAVVAGLVGESPDHAIAFVDDFTGLGAQMQRPLRTYSPAWKARLAMGCSLAVHSDIYVSDDKIAVGDTDFQLRCLAELSRRMSRSGLLFISKNRRHLELVCNRFYALHSGRLHPAGSAEEAEAIGQMGGLERIE